MIRETTYSIPGAPDLALVTDLHGTNASPVLTTLRAHTPSLICIAGDLIYGIWPKDGNTSPLVSQPTVLPFLRECVSIAPTYLSLGNHEAFLDEEDLRELRSTGVVILDNTYTRHGDGIWVGGLTSAYVVDYRERKAAGKPAKRYPTRYELPREGDTAPPNVSWLEEFCSASGYHILLCHHPEYISLIPPAVDLILAGHTHGGQLRFYNPLKRAWFGAYAPGQGLLPHYSRGQYGRLIVSAGLSNTVWLPRLFNPREVVYINTQTYSAMSTEHLQMLLREEIDADREMDLEKIDAITTILDERTGEPDVDAAWEDFVENYQAKQDDLR